MDALLQSALNVIGEVIKVAFIPSVIAMLIVVPSKPVLNGLPIPDEQRQVMLRIIRILGFVGTGVVLLAFVFLFGSLHLASKNAYVPPASVYEPPPADTPN